MTLQIQLAPGGVMPTWGGANPNAAIFEDGALDLHSRANLSIGPMSMATIPLGIHTAFAPNLVAVLKDRSGLAQKGLKGLAGVIDSGYRGEWAFMCVNMSPNAINIGRGDRVCQALFLTTNHPLIEEVIQLPESERGTGGFGSTGEGVEKTGHHKEEKFGPETVTDPGKIIRIEDV